MSTTPFLVQVPEGVGEGDQFLVSPDDSESNQQYAVTCQPRVSPGMQIQVNLPMTPPKIAATVTATSTSSSDDVSNLTAPTATVTQQLSFEAPPAYAPTTSNRSNNGGNSSAASSAPADAILVTQENRTDIMNHIKGPSAPGSMTMMMGEMPPGMSESDLFRSGVSVMPPPKDPSWKEYSPEDVADEYLHQRQGYDRITVDAPKGALGLTIGQKGPNLGHLVAVVKPTSPLKQSVRIMDELIALNDEDVTNYSTAEIIDALRSSSGASPRSMAFLRKMVNSNNVLTNTHTSISAPTTAPPKPQSTQHSSPPQALLVMVPQGVAPGQSFLVNTGAQKMTVICPPGVTPGMQLQIMPPASAQMTIINTSSTAQKKSISNANLQPWLTSAPDIHYMCCIKPIYTVCQAEQDFNAVAKHVGSSDRSSCTEFYGFRLSVGFCCWGGGGYCCNMGPRVTKLKTAYAHKYGLQDQSVDCCVFWTGPEFVMEHIHREHQARFGRPMER